MIKVVFISLLFLLFFISGCTNETHKSFSENKNTKTAPRNKIDTLDRQNDTDNRQQISIKNVNYALKIRQLHDSLHIVFQSKTKHLDTCLFNILPSDFILPCEALEIISNKSEAIDLKSYYLYKDTILLLPTMYTNGYTEYLWAINLYTGKVLADKNDSFSFYRYTHLPCFIFNKNNGYLLTTNSIDADNPYTGVRVYQIATVNVTHIKDMNENILFKVYDDTGYLKRIINNLAGDIRNK